MAVSQVLSPRAEHVPDPIERIIAPSAVAVDLLLDSTPHVVDDLGGELDDVEGVQHGGGVVEVVVDRVLVTTKRIQRRDLDVGEPPVWPDGRA